MSSIYFYCCLIYWGMLWEFYFKDDELSTSKNLLICPVIDAFVFCTTSCLFWPVVVILCLLEKAEHSMGGKGHEWPAHRRQQGDRNNYYGDAYHHSPVQSRELALEIEQLKIRLDRMELRGEPEKQRAINDHLERMKKYNPV